MLFAGIENPKPLPQTSIPMVLTEDIDDSLTAWNDGLHASWGVANSATLTLGKRLPTQAEFTSLNSFGSTPDLPNGRWFGQDHALKGNSKKSILLPFYGFRNPDTNILTNNGFDGQYWSSTNVGAIGILLSFGRSTTPAAIIGNPVAMGCAMRCVRDV